MCGQPVVLSNRAAALLKLERFSEAEDDCTTGLQLLTDIASSVVTVDSRLLAPAGTEVKVCTLSRLSFYVI